MDKKSENLIYFLLVFFAIYCSLIIGMAWDEPHLYEMGRNRLRYLFSFGKYEYQNFSYFANTSHFPGFYDTLTAFISQMIPRKYEIETHHLINLFFSFITILGITKITKSIFKIIQKTDHKIWRKTGKDSYIANKIWWLQQKWVGLDKRIRAMIIIQFLIAFISWRYFF